MRGASLLGTVKCEQCARPIDERSMFIRRTGK
jgi:hypothetical protein